MKFGVMLPHYRQMAGTEAIARVAQEAEEMGYDSVWVSDHIVVPDEDVERFGKGYYDLFSVLGYVAAITQRASLGTSIFIIPLRNPLHTAQIAATVDQLSGGRLRRVGGTGVSGNGSSLERAGRHLRRSSLGAQARLDSGLPEFPGELLQLLGYQLFPAADAAAPSTSLGGRG